MTVIDFTAEVEKRKEDLLADLFSLLEINSERDDSKADAQHPFGPGPVKALEKFLEIADRDGYPTKNVDNYAGHFEFGEGEEVLGIFAHMDVVPAGSGWDTDPYYQRRSSLCAWSFRRQGAYNSLLLWFENHQRIGASNF